MSDRRMSDCHPETRDLVALIGEMIRVERLERKMTVAALAEKVGISRQLLARIESGDLRVAIGTTLDVAAHLELRIIGSDPEDLAQRLAYQRRLSALMPKRAPSRREGDRS